MITRLFCILRDLVEARVDRLTELAPKPLHSRLRQLSQTSVPLFSLLMVRITVNVKSVGEIQCHIMLKKFLS